MHQTITDFSVHQKILRSATKYGATDVLQLISIGYLAMAPFFPVPNFPLLFSECRIGGRSRNWSAPRSHCFPRPGPTRIPRARRSKGLSRHWRKNARHFHGPTVALGGNFWRRNPQPWPRGPRLECPSKEHIFRRSDSLSNCERCARVFRRGLGSRRSSDCLANRLPNCNGFCCLSTIKLIYYVLRR